MNGTTAVILTIIGALVLCGAVAWFVIWRTRKDTYRGTVADKQVSGRVGLAGVPLDRIVPKAVADALDGTIDASGRFDGTGSSIAGVLAAMTGEGTYSVSGLRIERLDPQAPSVIAHLEASIEHDVLDTVDRITCPTLVVAGERDQLVPPAYGRELAERIASARLEVMEGPGTTHALLVERADEFNALALSFLKEVDRDL